MKYLGFRAAQWLSTRLPQTRAFALAEQLADVQWKRSTKNHLAVQTNLSAILGRHVPWQSTIAREVFRNFGRYLVEFFNLHRVQHPQVELHGHKHLLTARRNGRGAIILTAHLGNWEAGAVLLHRLRFPVTAVARPHQDPRLNRFFTEQRHRCGVTSIPLGHAAVAQCLASLRTGELVGMLGDLDFLGNGVRASCCGMSLLLPRGPATISLRAQVPIVPTFLTRIAPWRFLLSFEPPIWPESHSTPRSSVELMTRAYAAVLERYIRQFPDQWLVFQPILSTTRRDVGDSSNLWSMG